MVEITPVTQIDNKNHIALLDTSAISFMQGLKEKGIESDSILKDYDLILSIAEEAYSDLVNGEEGNLYQIVLAATYQIAMIKGYLRRFVEKADPLDMEAYRKDIRRVTYSKEQDDHSSTLVTEIVDNDFFVKLIQDNTVHIIF